MTNSVWQQRRIAARMAALEAAAQRRQEIAAIEAADPATQRRQRNVMKRQAIAQGRIMKSLEARGKRLPKALILSTARLVDLAEGKEPAPLPLESGSGHYLRR